MYAPEISTFTEPSAKDIQMIAQCITYHDLKSLETLVENAYSSNFIRKCIFNILFVAAAVGNPDICHYLMNCGFTVNSLSMHESILHVLPQTSEQTTHVSPLAISIHHRNLANIQFLLKHSSNDIIEKCADLPFEIEAMFLKEICTRLAEIHRPLHPKVVAGYEDGMPVLVVYSEKSTRNSEHFCKRKVKFANPKTIEREYSLSSVHQSETDPIISKENMNIARQIIHERGDSLWKAHSNLNIISMSAKKYVKGKEEIVPVCISLYCTTKGIIPLGEPTFPASLSTTDSKHELLVDVREGYFDFCTNYKTARSSEMHEKLKMGCSISKHINPTVKGTLGPLVDINGETGFLTCAHVLFDISNGKIDYHDKLISEIGVVQPDIVSNTFSEQEIRDLASIPCGHIKRAVFSPNVDNSIDAAIVQITNQTRVPDQGQFSIDSDQNYKDAELNEKPLFNSGALTNINDISTKSLVIKCGSTTHLTSGRLAASGIQVKPLNTSNAISPMQSFQMKNQLEIATSKDHSVFCEKGDSGAAVFVINADKSLSCIGMVIGITSKGTAVVTPIKDILEVLGPGVTLKSFGTIFS